LFFEIEDMVISIQ